MLIQIGCYLAYIQLGMHIFKVAFYGSGIIYAIIFQPKYFIPFLSIVSVYLLIGYVFLPDAKDLSNRKKARQCQFSDPVGGHITLRIPVRTEKVKQLIKSQKQLKLTLTHFAIKAVSEMLVSAPDLNGKVVFGRWVSYESVDVSVLVDIEKGNDLASFVIKGVEKMSVIEIANHAIAKGKEMKQNGGGKQHKIRNFPVKYLPVFVMSSVLEVYDLLTNKLGIPCNFLGFDRHYVGAACMTSIGSLGLEDSTAPFANYVSFTLIATINKAIKAPVVENDEIKVGEVMNCNFAINHQYVDGANMTKVTDAFRRVFQRPQEYLKDHYKSL